MTQNAVNVETAVQKTLAAYDVPGAIIAVAKDGELVSLHPLGYRDREQQLAVEKDTVFGIGSVTKSFTAVAIMQLVEAGRLSVDDPVVKHVPEFRLKNADVSGITIHHLLSHSAGLPPLGTLFAAMADSMREDPDTPNEQLDQIEPLRTFAEFFDFIAKQDVELLGEPGRYFSYSNDGYAVLGAVIEKVSGKTYEAFVEERILRPAGMANSGFDHRLLAQNTNVSMIYSTRPDNDEEVYASPVWWESKVMSPAGFLKSTASDMLRYAELFRTGGLVDDVRLLSEDSVQRMLTPHIKCPPEWFYGYGLMITPDFHGVLVAEHGGNIKGASAYMTVIPERALTAVMLSNLVTTPGEILQNAINAEMGLPLETKRVDLAPRSTDGVDLQEYAGQYISGEGVAVTFRVEDKALVVDFQGKTYPVTAVGNEDTFNFRVKEMDLTHQFLRDENGQIHAVHLGHRVIRKAPAGESAMAEAGAGE